MASNVSATYSIQKFIALLGIMVQCVPVFVVAQNNLPANLPNASTYGSCYGKALTADQYETVEKEVLIRDAYVNVIEIPAVYDSVTEQILVKESYTEYIPVPPLYDIVEEQVVVKEGSPLITESYENIVITNKVSLDYGQWVQKKDPNCFSKNPEDCFVLIWEKVPAKYDTLVQKNLTEMSANEAEAIAPVFKTFSKKVLKVPATVKEVYHPAEFQTITKRVLVSPAKTEQITIPAQYKKTLQKQLLKSGGEAVWVEVLCPNKINSNVIKQIQLALHNKGYYLKIDGIWGPKTKNALLLFQKNMGLPIGNINKETLAALYLLL